jgi:alkaline phosphatase
MNWLPPELASLAEGLPKLILDGVERNPLLGYGLIALAMLLENLIPPIPSELIMPLGGVLVDEGRLDFVPVVVAGLVGTVLGAWFWYGVGRLLRADRLATWLGSGGRLLGLGAESLAASQAWFGRHPDFGSSGDGVDAPGAIFALDNRRQPDLGAGAHLGRHAAGLQGN